LKTIKLGLLLLTPVAALATENRAVLETNYEVRAGYQNADFGNSYGLDARLTVPMLKLGGVSIVGGYDRFDGDDGVLDSDSYTVGAEAFLRDYEVGKLSAAFRYSETEFDRPDNSVNFDDSSSAKNYRAAGEYYFSNLTMAASRTYVDLENSDNAKIWGLSGFIYVKENTRLGIFGAHRDDKINYGGSMSHQPALLRNATELSISYQDVGDSDKIYSVSLAYYFDKRPSLIDRDRKYR